MAELRAVVIPAVRGISLFVLSIVSFIMLLWVLMVAVRVVVG